MEPDCHKKGPEESWQEMLWKGAMVKGTFSSIFLPVILRGELAHVVQSRKNSEILEKILIIKFSERFMSVNTVSRGIVGCFE